MSWYMRGCGGIMKTAAAAMLVALPFVPQAASADTYSDVEMVCPYDGTKFTFHAEDSGTQMDMGLDFMPMGAIAAPWPIASCPTNGFVFLQEKYTPEELEQLRPLILSAEFQALKDETPYFRAAWIRERTGAPRKDVVFTLLQATWEARDTPRYKVYAEKLLKRLPDDIGAAEKEEQFSLEMVMGELLRRLGRFEEARDYFAKILAQKDLPPSLPPIISFQQMLTAKSDSHPHAYSEAQDPPR